MITFTAAEIAQIDEMVVRIQSGEMKRDSFVRTTDMQAALQKANYSERRARELFARQVVEVRTK